MHKKLCLLPALALALLCACSRAETKTPPTREAVASTERQFTTPAVGDTIAVFDTSLGEVRAVLYPDTAPMAVYNFVGLARSGYYDNTSIWRSEYGFAVQGGNSQFYFVTALPDSASSEEQQAELAQNGYTDSQVAAYAAAGGLPYLDNTDTVFGQVYQGMDIVDAMACVDTVKDEDGNDTYHPTEEAAITIYHVTITTYAAEPDNGLETVG